MPRAGGGHQLEHPLPDFRAEGQIDAVYGLPLHHRTILDGDTQLARFGLAAEFREEFLERSQVLLHAAEGVAPGEGADDGHAHALRQVKHSEEISSRFIALGSVRRKEVRIVAQRGDFEVAGLQVSEDFLQPRLAECIGIDGRIRPG